MAVMAGEFGRIAFDWDCEGEWVETVLPCRPTDGGAMPIADAWQKLKEQKEAECDYAEAQDRHWEERIRLQRRLLASWSDDHAQLEYLQDRLEGRRLRGSDLVDQGLIRVPDWAWR